MAGTALLAASALWWQSYRRNLDYVDAVRTRVEQLTQRIGSLESASLEQVLPLYSLLERLAANDGIDPNEPPAGFGFGLFQGPRLARSAEQAYREMLDRSLAPLLVERLRRDLREAEDSATRYEALRASLMLVNPERLVRGELRPWAEQALVQASGAGERAEWASHVEALLERSGLPEAMRSDDAGCARRAAPSRRCRWRSGCMSACCDAYPTPSDRRICRRASAPPSPSCSPRRTPGRCRRIPAPATGGATFCRRSRRRFDEFANEADWVLGDAVGEVRRLQKDRAWRDEIPAGRPAPRPARDRRLVAPARCAGAGAR